MRAMRYLVANVLVLIRESRPAVPSDRARPRRWRVCDVRAVLAEQLAHASARTDADRYLRLRASPALGWPDRRDPARDVVTVGPNEKHWHGASPTTAMTHIAIQEPRRNSR